MSTTSEGLSEMASPEGGSRLDNPGKLDKPGPLAPPSSSLSRWSCDGPASEGEDGASGSKSSGTGVRNTSGAAIARNERSALSEGAAALGWAGAWLPPCNRSMLSATWKKLDSSPISPRLFHERPVRLISSARDTLRSMIHFWSVVSPWK
jgi:hypothetical protein